MGCHLVLRVHDGACRGPLEPLLPLTKKNLVPSPNARQVDQDAGPIPGASIFGRGGLGRGRGRASADNANDGPGRTKQNQHGLVRTYPHGCVHRGEGSRCRDS
jgi:hypothetical protein